MISGPDLGGGFLHQLTRQRAAAGCRFTFHAQEGGEDAGGPPRGTPEPLGWTLAGSMCPIGGRRCWHRHFDLPDAETGPVRAAYQRTRLVMELSIEQAGGRARPTWEGSFSEAFDRLAAEGRSEPLPWALSHVMLAPQTGRPAPDREIVLVTTETGVARIAAALREYLIEPAAPTDWPRGPVHGGRAFVGTPREGARIAWRAIRGRSERIDDLPALTWADRTVPVSSM